MSEHANTRATAHVTEFLLLPNGTILVHNLTSTMAGLLSELNPEDEAMRERAKPDLKKNTNPTASSVS